MITPTELSALRKWICETIAAHSYERHAELHVVAIHARFRDPSTWIDVACQCLKAGTSCLRQQTLPFRLTVDFCLKNTSQPMGWTFHTREQVESELDYQPPSLHLFPEGVRFPDETLVKNEMPLSLLGCDLEGAVLRYTESFSEVDGSYRRFLWIEVPLPLE